MNIKGKNFINLFKSWIFYNIFHKTIFCNNIKMELIPQTQFVKSENHSSFKD